MPIEFTKADQQLIQKACTMATEVRDSQTKFEKKITKVVTENLSDIVAKTVAQALREQDVARRKSFNPVAADVPEFMRDKLSKIGSIANFSHEPNEAEVIVHFKEADGALPLTDEQKHAVSVEFGKLIKQMADQKGFEKLEIKYKKHGN